MKSLLHYFKIHLVNFIENSPTEKKSISLYSNQMIATISKATLEQTPVHIISNSESLTGQIVHYDKEKRRLILNNQSKNLSTVIELKDIQKISLLPIKR